MKFRFKALVHKEVKPGLFGWLATFVSAFAILGWLCAVIGAVFGWCSLIDVLLWPIENALHALDLLDLMEIYHLHLRVYSHHPYVCTASVAIRVLVALFVAMGFSEGFRVLSFRRLGGFGLGQKTLEETAAEFPEDQQVQQVAAKRLAQIRSARVNLKLYWGGTRAWGLGILCLLTVPVVLCLLQTPPGWKSAQRRLTVLATGADLESAQTALAALSGMGPEAKEAIPVLIAKFPHLPQQQQELIVRALGCFGPPAVQALGTLLQQDRSKEIDLSVIHALQGIGPPAAPALLHGFDSRFPDVQAQAREAISSWGPRVVPALVKEINLENVATCMELIQKLDPYWHTRGVFQRGEGINLKRGGELLKQVKKTSRVLTKIDRSAIVVFPYLFERFVDPEFTQSRRSILTNLNRIAPRWPESHYGKKALPHLLMMGKQGHEPLRMAYEKWHKSTEAKEGISHLSKAVESVNSTERLAALQTLAALGPFAVNALPQVTRASQDPDKQIRNQAQQTLSTIQTQD